VGCALIDNIANLEPLSSVRAKLNETIDAVNMVSPASYASLSTSENTDATPITTQGAFVKAVVDESSAGPTNNGFTVSANRITYAGPTKTFAVDAIVTETGANNVTAGLRIAKNGVSCPLCDVRITMPVSARPITAPVQGIFTLEDGDFLEVFVANFTNTADLTVRMINMRAVQIGG
jgi:hypothetical protein